MYYIGTTFLHRNAVSSNDAAFPTVKSGIDCGLYDSIVLEISITGTSTPTWTVTPGYWSDLLGIYCAGSALQVSSGTSGGYLVYEIDTLGNSDIYIMCSASSGTSPVITIYAKQIRKG